MGFHGHKIESRAKAPKKNRTSLSGRELKALMAEPPPEKIESVAAIHARFSVEALATLLNHGGELARIMAARQILDRGYGRLAVDLAPEISAEIRDQARGHARVAVATLRMIVENGDS